MRRYLTLIVIASLLAGCSELARAGKSQAWNAGYDFGLELSSESMLEANAACQFAYPYVFASESQTDFDDFVAGCIESSFGSSAQNESNEDRNGAAQQNPAEIDSTYAENFLRTNLHENLGIWFITECPPNMRGKEGDKFTCFACPELYAVPQFGGGYFYGDDGVEFRCDAAYEGFAVDYEVVNGQILLNNDSTRRANPSAANSDPSNSGNSSQGGTNSNSWFSEPEEEWTAWLESVFLRNEGGGRPALELTQSAACDGCQTVNIRLGFERMPGDSPQIQVSLYSNGDRYGVESLRLGKAFYTDDADLEVANNRTSKLAPGDELEVRIRLFNFDLQTTLFGVLNSTSTEANGSESASGSSGDEPEQTTASSVKEEWLKLLEVWMDSVTISTSANFEEVPNIFQGCPQDMCGYVDYEIGFGELSVPNCEVVTRIEDTDGKLLNRHRAEWSSGLPSPYGTSPTQSRTYLDGVSSLFPSVSVKLRASCNTAYGLLRIERGPQIIGLRHVP